MPYIGRSSNFGVRTRFLYTATASQTTFSGTDTQNLTLSYSDSNFIDVHQNGVLLKVVDDYTATSGTSVVLATGATASDVIEITVYDVFSIANHIKKTGDAMAGALTNIDIDGTELVLDADGDTSITADTDDQIDIRIGGADDFAFKANKFEVQTGSNIDMNGTELILDADGDTSIEASSDDTIQIKIAGSEKLRIDDGGDIIIGKTAQNNTAAGTVLQNDGFASFVRDGKLSLILNRLTDDGTIVDFRKDGTTVGSIGVADSGDRIYLGGSGANRGIAIDSSASVVIPSTNTGGLADALIGLGTSTARFTELFLSSSLRLTDSSNTHKYSITSLSSDALQFYDTTANAERMRIDSSGNVLVGTTSLTTGTLGSSNTFLELSAGTNNGSGTLILSRNTTTDGNEVGGVRFANQNN